MARLMGGLAGRIAPLALVSLVIALGACLVEAINPLGLSSATRQYTITLFQVGYSAKIDEQLKARGAAQQDRVRVVLLLDQDIGPCPAPDGSVPVRCRAGVPQADAWPVSYAYHALVLDRLTLARPKAIFVDIGFFEERWEGEGKRPTSYDGCRDPGPLDALADVVEFAGEEGIPVLFAASEHAANEGRQEAPLGLHCKLSDRGALPVVVAAGSSEDAYTIYPLARRIGGCRLPGAAVGLAFGADAYAPGCEPPGNRRDQGAASAHLPQEPAFQFLWATCPELPWRLDAEKDAQGWDPLIATLSSNRPQVRILEFLAWNALSSFAPADPDGDGPAGGIKSRYDRRCPPVPTIPVSDLFAYDDARLKAEFGDKYVLYGVELELLEDHIDPPTTGAIPGIYMHAMALENLLWRRALQVEDERSGAVSLPRPREAELARLIDFRDGFGRAHGDFLESLVIAWLGVAVTLSAYEAGFARFSNLLRRGGRGRYVLMVWSMAGMLVVHVALLLGVLFATFWWSWERGVEPVDVVFILGLITLPEPLAAIADLSRGKSAAKAPQQDQSTETS